MERTEIASLYRCPPADGTKLTVCGWAKNIRCLLYTSDAADE